ncbi:MAG: hypothetical protein ACJAS1_001462 [Oleiphilaceae bacterium]|jgi:hypothetical protein
MKPGNLIETPLGQKLMITCHGSFSEKEAAMLENPSWVLVSADSVKNKYTVAKLGDYDIDPKDVDLLKDLGVLPKDVAMAVNAVLNEKNPIDAEKKYQEVTEMGYEFEFNGKGDAWGLRPIDNKIIREPVEIRGQLLASHLRYIIDAKAAAMALIASMSHKESDLSVQEVLENKQLHDVDGNTISFEIIDDRPFINIERDGVMISRNVPAFPVFAVPNTGREGEYVFGSNVENGRPVVVDEGGVAVVHNYNVIAGEPTSDKVYVEDPMGNVLEVDSSTLDYHAALSKLETRKMASELSDFIEKGFQNNSWKDTMAAGEALYTVDKLMNNPIHSRQTATEAFMSTIIFLGKEKSQMEERVSPDQATMAKIEELSDKLFQASQGKVDLTLGALNLKEAVVSETQEQAPSQSQSISR